MTLIPAPFILATTMVDAGMPPLWRLIAATIAALACLAAALFLLRRPRIGRIFAVVTVAASVVTVYPSLASDPVAALLGAVAVIGAFFAVKDFQVRMEQQLPSTGKDRSLQRAQGSAATLPFLLVGAVLVDPSGHDLADGALAGAVLITQTLVIHWLWRRPEGIRVLGAIGATILVAGLVVLLLPLGHVRPAALAASLLTVLALPRTGMALDRHEHWWETLINHPARMLFSTFFGLCLLAQV